MKSDLEFSAFYPFASLGNAYCNMKEQYPTLAKGLMAGKFPKLKGLQVPTVFKEGLIEACANRDIELVGVSDAQNVSYQWNVWV
jgi:hypothetical protein